MGIVAIVVVAVLSILILWVLYKDVIHPSTTALESLKKFTGALEGAKSLTNVEIVALPKEVRSPVQQYINGLAKDSSHSSGAESIISPAHIAYRIVNSEFTRHLPGMATAVGIIGSFIGLTGGLSHYNPDSNASVVLLIREVKLAFFGSLGAIVVAVGVTYFEKDRTNKLVNRIADLVDLIDELHHVRPAEVQLIDGIASLEVQLIDGISALKVGIEKVEQHSKQTTDVLTAIQKSINDAHISTTESIDNFRVLVSDFTNPILTDGFASLGDNIRDGIVEILQEPLNAVTQSIQQTTQSTNDGVQQLLTQVLSDFQKQLEGTFGEQMQSITDSNIKTAQTIEAAQFALGELIEKIAEVNKQSSQAMSESIADSLDAISEEQQNLLDSLHGIVESMGDSMRNSVTQSNQASESALAQMTNTLDMAIKGIHDAITAAGEDTAAVTAETLEAVAERQDKLISTINDLVRNMEGSFQERDDKLSRTSDALLSKFADNVNLLIDNMSTTVTAVTSETSKTNASTMAALGQIQQQVASAIDNVGSLVSSMRKLQTDAFATMNAGAADVKVAFDSFNGSTQSLTQALTLVTPAIVQLKSATDSINTVVQSFTSISQTQKETLVAAHETSKSLTSAVSSTREISTSLREQSKTISELLTQVQQVEAQVAQHTRQISAAMTTGMEQFGTETNKQVERVFRVVTHEVNTGLNALSSALQSMSAMLGEALDRD
jgi:putative membrane protein